MYGVMRSFVEEATVVYFRKFPDIPRKTSVKITSRDRTEELPKCSEVLFGYLAQCFRREFI